MTTRRTVGWRRARLGAGFAVVSALMLRTTPAVLTGTLPYTPGDSSLVVWVLSWGTHAAFRGPGGWFDGNIFWPRHDTLAYHDTLLPLVPVWAVLHGITGSWTLSLNLLVLGLMVGNLAATYALTLRLTGRRDAALVAALAFCFSGYVMAHAGHVQLLAVGLLPLDLLLALRLLDQPTPWRGVALGASTAATFLVSAYYGIVWAFCLVALVVVHLAVARRRPPAQLVVAIGVAAAVAALAALPVVLAVVRLQDDPTFRRPIAATEGFRLRDALSPAPRSWLYRDVLDPSDGLEHRFVPGFVVGALAVAGAVALVRRRVAGVRRGEIGLVLVAAAVGLLLSRTTLGPYHGQIPILWLKEHVPGMAGMRVPARFAVVGLLASAVLAGVGAAWLVDRMPRRRLALGALVVVVLVELAAPIPRPRFPDDDRVLAVYRVLEDRAHGPVVELPMVDPSGTAGAFAEGPRMVYSTIDWHDRVNGYSAFVPAGQVDDVELLNTFPAPAALRRLDELGVRYVVLDVAGPRVSARMSERDARDRIRRLPQGAVAERHGDAWLVTLNP